MAKRIKWITDGVNFRRGNYQTLAARLNNCNKWVLVGAICSAQAFKSRISRFAQTFGATEVEIKPFYDEVTGEPLVKSRDCVAIRSFSDGSYYIFTEGPKQNIEVMPSEIFN